MCKKGKLSKPVDQVSKEHWSRASASVRASRLLSWLSLMDCEPNKPPHPHPPCQYCSGFYHKTETKLDQDLSLGKPISHFPQGAFPGYCCYSPLGHTLSAFIGQPLGQAGCYFLGCLLPTMFIEPLPLHGSWVLDSAPC